MAAAYHDIVIEEGSTFDLYVTEYLDECTKRDVTGYGAKFQIRKEPKADQAVLYEATVVNGRIQIQPSGETGMFHIHLPIDVVNSPVEVWDVAYWDLLIWDGDSSASDGAKRLIQGKAKWSPAVTRP